MSKSEENLNKRVPFKKGKDERRNTSGRPRKLVSSINKELEAKGVERVTNSQVLGAIQNILNLDRSELEVLAKDKNTPILYGLLAKELLSKNGAKQLESILDRAFGKAKQQIESSNNNKTEINISNLDLSKLSVEELRILEKALKKDND